MCLFGFHFGMHFKEEGKLKSKIAIALCLISVVGTWGIGIAGNLDTRGGDEGGVFSTVSGISEQEAVAGFPARVEKTGQTTSYGSRDDGRLRKGVAWPVPRFADNGNGTVTDRLTGLIWLKNANCGKFFAEDATGQNYRCWNDALKAANKLKDGYCGLTDSSVAGNWRLPNSKELYSLIDLGLTHPALSDAAGTGHWSEGDAFSDVQSFYYWTSTTVADNSVYAWVVNFFGGFVNGDDKPSTDCVWPVRGGQ